MTKCAECDKETDEPRLGLCPNCRQKKRRRDRGLKKPARYDGVLCIEEGCPNQATKKYRCDTHYQGWRYHNVPGAREAQSLARLKTYYRKRYGMTLEEAERFIQKHKTCNICGTSDWSGRYNKPHIDHDHVTGEIRGLLCQNCNVGLGQFKDSPILLAKAMLYLSKFKPEEFKEAMEILEKGAANGQD